MWQTNDLVPNIPRVHRFLNYWHHNIDATIHDVEVAYGREANWRAVDHASRIDQRSEAW